MKRLREGWQARVSRGGDGEKEKEGEGERDDELKREI